MPGVHRVGCSGHQHPRAQHATRSSLSGSGARYSTRAARVHLREPHPSAPRRHRWPPTTTQDGVHARKAASPAVPRLPCTLPSTSSVSFDSGTEPPGPREPRLLATNPAQRLLSCGRSVRRSEQGERLDDLDPPMRSPRSSTMSGVSTSPRVSPAPHPPPCSPPSPTLSRLPAPGPERGLHMPSH
ncbi:hypothetical protein B0H17DRAFT_1050874 [Mycena rosella]|uniref:Uncharacterized protein n=1 Tax=Mycena rosella TaxID=1033263 RepID=A0AAD7DS13_MYCRO|nr:hypothetical protein B0H17DRAFT_1050874 [Mycena rosella]